MSPSQLVVIVILATLPIDFLLVWAVARYAAADFFNPLAERYPWRDPPRTATRKNFLSFQLHGYLNFSFCLHAIADDRFIHILPARLPRLGGARPSSVPRSEIHRKPGSTSGQLPEGTVGGIIVRISPWIFDRAASAEEKQSPPHR